jgi:CRP-like cAMP-binding protein
MESALFGQRLGAVLADEPDASIRTVQKRRHVYACGSCDENIYFVVAGQLKLTMLSAAGRECLLQIYVAGDFFGESCLSTAQRVESVTAMSDALLRHLPGARFLAVLSAGGLTQEFVRHLAVRISDQQQTIAKLATVDCEYRLADLLLRLSQKLGAAKTGGMMQRFSHEELSQMVGTTRPRISELMQRFRILGLIDTTPVAHMLIREPHLQHYLQTRHLEMRVGERAF